ncbi:MAG: tetratricopeptide repeat protein [Candidatus Sericytochromatia bacterium]|nr:tetratricopeptide repeat protein [Candidatus Tanganyikabacteria bacterium]
MGEAARTPEGGSLPGQVAPEDWELLPQDAAEHYNEGLRLIKAGRRPEAEDELRRAIAIRSDHAPALNNLGLLLLARGAVPEAIDTFGEAIRARPQYARPYNNLGVAYLRLNKLDWAIAQFRRALLVDPDYAAARKNLAVALGRREQVAAGYRDGALALQALAATRPAGASSPPRATLIEWLRRLLGRAKG